jgi:hypothetical protein
MSGPRRLPSILLAIAMSIASSPGPSSAQSVRAPYLQSPTETAITIAWRTAADAPSRVCWGSSPDALVNAAGSGAAELRHAVRITGLSPATRYHYAVGGGSCPPPTPGDARDTFQTAPPRGSRAPFRMWIVGDSGTGGARQDAVTDAMIAATADRRPDLYLHMGDMAYSSGLEAEFDTRFFAMYEDVLRNVPCWPTMGNHEGINADSATESGPYYDAYILPTDGSAGGLPSGTEAYYSFDWGNAHFVVLDSHDSPRAPDGAMLTWLDDDLAAADATWLVAYFHHPPYTDGSHDSDTERQLIDMRQNAGPILEAHGVDLVLACHSHIYERSWLLRGAFDTPTTAAGHVVDMGDGRFDGDGPYRGGADGTVYVVAGHGGAGVSGAGDHPVMHFTEVANGSCLVDVDGDELTLRNIRYDGLETDRFTLLKREGLFLASPLGGETFFVGSPIAIAWSSVGATAIAAVRIEASLDGGATWSTVIERTEEDGLHEWAPPEVETAQARIRISDADDPARSDESGDFAISASASMTAIARGDVWQYSDDDTAHPDAWRTGAGDGWSEGRAQLGYGDGDESTRLRDASPNVPTVYFRRTIDVPAEVVAARVRGVFDDAIAVWVNGVLVTARNVDDGLEHAVWASAASDDNEVLDAEIDLAASNPFVVGENWVAAIVKQAGGDSSDLSFDLSLEVTVRRAIPPPTDGGGAIASDGAPRIVDGALPASPDSGRDGGDVSSPLSGGCGCRIGGRHDERRATHVLIAIALIGLGARARRRR